LFGEGVVIFERGWRPSPLATPWGGGGKLRAKPLMIPGGRVGKDI